MKQETLNHTDYDPAEHIVDAKAVLAGFVLLLATLVVLVAAA